MISVVAVCSRTGYHFSKTPSLGIRLLKGLGVAGDAHMGETVKQPGDTIRVELPAEPHRPLQPV
jgi:hypothetical protein